MKKQILLAAAASLALMPAASAQMSQGQPSQGQMKQGQMAPGSKAPPSAPVEKSQLRPADQAFVTKAANGGMFEVQSSELAVDRAQNAELKSFARQMIKDHGKANNELQSGASALGANVPSSLDSKHAQALQKLEGMKGPEFDQGYVQAQRDAHREAVSLFSTYSKANGALSAWAGKTLPMLQQHQQHIQQIGGVAEGGNMNRSGRASTTGGAADQVPAPAPKSNMKSNAPN